MTTPTSSKARNGRVLPTRAHRRQAPVWALLAFVAMGSSTARADGAGALRAEGRFRDGERLFEAHDYSAACDALLESERLDPQLGTLRNLALCHEAVGRAAMALREYDDAAAWAVQRGQPDRERFAHDHALLLAARVGAVHLELP